MHSKPRRGLENELAGSFFLFSEHQAELSGEKTSNWEGVRQRHIMFPL